jgi:tetratricopeptide (TPR) repeat protein
MNNHIQQKKTLKLLLKAEKTNHGNPNHSYQISRTYNQLGKEREAIPFYQKAIGRYASANQTFRKGIKRFLEDNAMKVFYAMNLFNLKKYQKSLNCSNQIEIPPPSPLHSGIENVVSLASPPKFSYSGIS